MTHTDNFKMYYLENFCFLCLKADITTTLHNVDVEEKLQYLISTYQVLQLSRIPKHFCDNCLENLNSFYDFKHKCVNSIVISNYYVQKLSQKKSTFAYLSVRLPDILENNKSDTKNSIDASVGSMSNELINEVFAVDNYEQRETVEIQQGKPSEEQVSFIIENETNYFEMKREINGELIIKNENSDDNDYIFECETCLLTFSTEVLLIAHTAECSSRTRSFEAVNRIQNDTESDNKNDTTVDTLANNEESSHAFSLNSLKIHQRTHSDIKLNECDVCKKTFSQKCNLKQHKRIHAGEKPYECNFCKKTFNQKAHLNQHERIHTGEKPYECDVCKRLFTYKSALIRHKRIHTGARPYECDVCEKNFNRKVHLIQHERIHTGEKPYECDVCKKSFRAKSASIRHKRIHTGARPYECDVCKK